MPNLALYIHWPFCKSKCPYCDFNSHVRDGIDEQAWQQAYLTELDYFSQQLGTRQITSIFFGGGTPSLMPPECVEAIITKADESWGLAPDAEITLEANPTSVEAEKFQGFKAAGVNRLSLGIQALNDADLKFLGREHSATEVLAALDIAKSTFNNVSFDLIYARPNQTVEDWHKELEQALTLADKHLSLYQLTIEKGTPFYSAHASGDLTIPESALAAELYELTEELTTAADFNSYEVSNYAKPGFESRHNLSYWRYEEYLGIGPGAHSRVQNGVGRRALMMWHNPEKWLEQVQENHHGIQSEETLSQENFLSELLMMGLRLKEGISHENFTTQTGNQIHEILPQETLTQLQNTHLILLDQTGLRTTPQGRLVINSIASEILVTS